ncbi:m7GpppX diphosphatase [Psilocybe cubensis]|uniref:Scavenger mRNA decapping enzyme n=2 Tax=Psilocybe cubensis TaxID=181762 RepID=A0A8H8CMK3_PSICU|nr:m7GpppX diphosphatase [Psilocybe cubensis]KAH9480345.1 m7GpppX diphosphatase [Psilocybe cubensis]
MADPSCPQSLSALNKFAFEKVINEDPSTHSLILLGTLPAGPQEAEARVRAIARIEKTALSIEDAPRLLGEKGMVNRAELGGSTDIYTWLYAWLGENRERDIKINVISPATDVHIKKYTKQQQVMVHETPEIYEKFVKPYIASFPASRTQWVENILTGISEQDKILYSSSDFVILPDMKWDLKTLTSLYLMAIVKDKTIRSLRDLRRSHLGLLKSIREEAYKIVQGKWGLGRGSLRIHVHYQPSYYHFHVHIVNVNHVGSMLGLTVGQAHLLDDLISMLELDPIDGPGIFERITLTYGLGDQHGLFQIMQKNALA